MRGVIGFLAAKLLRALVAVWLVTTVVFVVMRLSGDPVPLLLPPDAPTSEMERVRRELGLDRPLPVQYLKFVGNALRGDVVTETIFAWPGIGRLAIQSIANRDYAVVQCTVFLSAILFIVLNFAIDLFYGVLDPRVRPR